MINVLYAGSPEASAKTLEILIKNSNSEPSTAFKICGVLTNAPSVQGRHKTPVPTPVETLAQSYNIPVFNPEHLDTPAREAVAAVKPDILVCFAYGHIFGPKFMALFKFGGINLHPSRLPEYRGCTPVNAAILNRNETTAFSIQKVSPKMDEGNLLSQEEVKLSGKETAFSLLNDAAAWGGEELKRILTDLSKTMNLPEGKVQEGNASYTSMIKKEDARLNWRESALEIDAKVRGYFSNPCAWTQNSEGTLKILEGLPVTEEEALSLINGAPAAQKIEEEKRSARTPGRVSAFVKGKGILIECGTGFYAITRLQKQGKNEMDYKSFMNGSRNFIGSVLE